MKKYLIPTAIVLAVGLAITAVTSIRPNIQSFEQTDLIHPDPEVNVIGYRSAYTMEQIIETMLNKRGGYTSNDILPPFVLMDDMPNWEFGVLSTIRENSILFRRSFTRSTGAQSTEDADAVEAQTFLNNDSNKWIFPSMESRLELAQDHYKSLITRLLDDNPNDGNFYARATSFSEALTVYNKLLGSLSHRLQASVGGTNLPGTANDISASEAKHAVTAMTEFKTPWTEIDDIFWEAMGAAWALEQIFTALEYDFAKVLEKKNAQLTVRQIRDDLRRAQEVVMYPWIFNGGFGGIYGGVTNDSLVLASYISKASATIVTLKKLIDNG